MKYQQANQIAINLRKELEPFCVKIDIAGDVAKELSEVISIKMFALPKRLESGDFLPGFINALMKAGEFSNECNKDSKSLLLYLWDAIELEIIIPDKKNYYHDLVTHETGVSFRMQVELLLNKMQPFDQSLLKTEYHFFEWLGLKWIPINQRN